MKKIFTSILLCVSITTAFGQNIEFTDIVNISRERWRDSLLRIDKSQVPSGFLFEYSLAGVDLSKFNGLNSDTLKNEGQILSLHEILYSSKVNNNAQIAPTDSLDKQANQLYNSNKTVALIFIYQNYNRIRATALNEGLFSIASDDVGILDVPGRTVSPYDTYELFAFSPYKQTIKQFNNINFTLPDELFYMQGLTTVEVDFGDGTGYRTLSKGGNIAIYYSTEGIKYLTARITTNNGVKLAKSQIDYKRPASYTEPDLVFNIPAEPVYTNDDDYFGIFGRNNTLNTSSIVVPSAKVEIVNGCGGVFDKPIIIVEGFDPEGDFDIEEYKDRFRSNQFAITMSNYGYDFVYVDFTDNTTYIENNAKVLEEVINKVNEIKVGNNKSSIIGFSMGGLIARWCLKDMEDRNIDHQVENYFSYDAPHQGANSILGMQYIGKELERDLPYLRFNKSFKKTLDGLRSPAARQMLITYADYNNSPFNWQPTLNTLNPLRASFAQRLVDKGYPQTTNNYGIAFGRGNNITNKDAGNGSQFTNTNPYNAGDQIFDGGINFLLVSVFASAWAVPENNNKSSIAGYSFAGLTFRKIFNIPVLPVYILRNRNFQLRNLNSYDDAPGGFDNTQRAIKDSWVGGLSGPATTFEHDAHCFIPTVSALDLQNQTYGAGSNWQSNNLYFNIDGQIQNVGAINGNDLINPSLSPFKAIITSSTEANDVNRFHNGDINARFAAFIQRKILNANPINCAGANGLCSINPSIIGTVNNCLSTFSIDPLPNDVTINWSSKFGYISITNGQGTRNVTIARIQNIADTLFATLTNACGATLVIERVIPIADVPPIVGAAQLCSSESYSIPNLPVGSTITWFLSPSSGIATLTASGNSATLTKIGNGMVQLSATYSNLSCSSIPVTPFNISVGEPIIGEFSIDYNVFNDLCRPQDRYTVPAISGATYSWSVNNPKILLNQQGNSCLVYGGPITQGTGEDFEITVTVSNSCGSASNTYIYGYYYKPTREECLNNQYSRYSIYPNPANSDLTIEYAPVEESSIEKTNLSTKQKDVKLFNNKGEIMASSMMKENELKLILDTKNIPDGTYFLHITEGKETVKKQIIIKH